MSSHHNAFTFGPQNFSGQVFSFLHNTIPSHDQKDGVPIQLTSCDANQEIIGIGSNIGVIYGFRRRTLVTDDSHFKCNISSGKISVLRIINNDSIAAASGNTLYVWTISGEHICWKWTASSVITCLQIYTDEDTCPFLLFGTCEGQVFRHDLQVSETPTVIFEECISCNNHHHELVQIQILSPSVFLISSCFRTVILKSDENGSVSSVQIGKNERKVCGKYGAVSIPQDELVYASRPKSHLVRADIRTGEALETFILKNAPKPDSCPAFSSFRKRNETKNTPTSGNTCLGKLEVLNSQTLLSWTSSSVLIVSIDGSLILDERCLDGVVDVTCLFITDREFELFILMSNRCFLRITNIKDKEDERIPGYDENTYTCMDGEPFFPFVLPTLTLLGNEFKKVLYNFTQNSETIVEILDATSLTKGYCSKRQEEKTPPIYLNDEEIQKHDSGPLVVRKRVRKRKMREKQKNGMMFRGLKDSSSISSNTNTDSRSETSSSSIDTSSQKTVVSVQQKETTKQEFEDTLIISPPEVIIDSSNGRRESLNETEKLQKILMAYNEKNEEKNCFISSLHESASEYNDIQSHHQKMTEEDEVLKIEVIVESVETSSIYGNPNREQKINDDQSITGGGDHFMRKEREASHEDLRGGDQEDEWFETFSNNNDETEERSKGLDENNLEVYEERNGDLGDPDHHVDETRAAGEEVEAINLEMNPYAFLSDRTYLKWDLLLPSSTCTLTQGSQLVSVSALDDEMRVASALLASFDPRKSKTDLYIYPGLRKLKLPHPKSKLRQFDVSSDRIFLLTQDGTLYNSPLDCHFSLNFQNLIFGAKWSKIEMKRSLCRFISVSVNRIDNICWLCHEDGVAWLYKTRSSKWLLVRDDRDPPLELKSISVSPENSGIVWAIDSHSDLYVRQGIFNDKSDCDSLIAGIDWVRLDDVPGVVTRISAGRDTIWILSLMEGGEERLFRRRGINPPKSYIGSQWEEVLLPLLFDDSISGLSGNKTFLCHLILMKI